MKTKAELLPECPVAATVQLIGNKWKLLIMRNLLARPWRFNELYSLSELGETMRPILNSMQAWGENYKMQQMQTPQ